MIEPNYERMVELIQDGDLPEEEIEAVSLLRCTYWGTSDAVREIDPDLYHKVAFESYDLRADFNAVQEQARAILAAYAMTAIDEELRNGTRQP